MDKDQHNSSRVGTQGSAAPGQWHFLAPPPRTKLLVIAHYPAKSTVRLSLLLAVNEEVLPTRSGGESCQEERPSLSTFYARQATPTTTTSSTTYSPTRCRRYAHIARHTRLLFLPGNIIIVHDIDNQRARHHWKDGGRSGCDYHDVLA